MSYIMTSTPDSLPCDRATDEYGPRGYLKEQYGAFRGGGYLPLTPEQQKAKEARMKRLNERLAEIEADMLAARKN